MTACSVVANGDDFERAAELLRGTPSLDAGVHLALVGVRPVAPPDGVRSLLTSGGELLPDYPAFLARYLAGRIDLSEVARELRAQAARVVDAGLAPSHLNSHQHLHVLPGLLDVTIALARELGIGYVRSPREVGVPPTPRGLQVAALGLLAARAAVRIRAAGLRTNDRALGIASAGRLRADGLVRAIARTRGSLPERRSAAHLRQRQGSVPPLVVSEVVAHPGVDDRAVARAYRWGYAWDAEREALSAPGLREAIARAGLSLLSPRALVRTSGGFSASS